MYNFPEEAKLKELIGQKLEIISCTANQIIFNFSNKVSIDAIASFWHINKWGAVEKESVPISNIAIFGLLECEICAINITNKSREMVLSFKNGESLKFQSDTMYESVYIYIRDERIIV